MKMIFLGTGGGRHMMNTQVRRTGGTYFDLGDTKFLLDPGPGSLVAARSLKLPIDKCNGVLLSHMHVDHSCDVNVLLDGMNEPFLVAEEHCVRPKQKTKADFDYFPCVTSYHQERAHVHAVTPGDKVKIGATEIEAVRSKHNDPTVGFVIRHPGATIGYTSDGAYYPGQEKHFSGCDVLIANVIIPKGKPADKDEFMSVDGAVNLLRNMKERPKRVVMTHFSFWMLHSNLFRQAKILQDATKTNVLIAEDFMELDLGTLQAKTLKAS